MTDKITTDDILGKKLNGRLLDGREWNQMPGVRHA